MRPPYRRRRTVWLDLDTGAGVADVGAAVQVAPARPVAFACGRDGGGALFDPAEQLGALLDGLPAGAERVYLTGAVPWSAWLVTPPPAPWIVGARGHYPDEATPALRYRQPLQDHDVELRAASEWFPDATPRECRDTAELLETRITRARKSARNEWASAILLASPSATGRYLLELLDALPEPLTDEAREIVRHATVGGRMHLAPAPRAKAKVGALAYYDARVAYGALAQMELGHGPGRLVNTAGALPLDAGGRLSMRGVLNVTVRVPDDWAHVGILGERGAGGMVYPASPAQQITGWWDAAEVALAHEHGWRIECHEALVLDQAPVLKGWATSLETLWRQLGELDDVPARVVALARGAVRGIVLKTIGALHTDSYRTRTVYATPAEVPAGVQFHQDESGAFVAETRTPARDAFPELTSQIWARGRVRLLDAPTATAGVRAGALHVEPAELVAMRTDALYLACKFAPPWTDDGKWGRYRLKGVIHKPRTWPTTANRLLVLREEAERAMRADERGNHGK